MSGLVHEQPARLLLVPVPATEVVGAVACVEQVVHVHLDHLADHALLEQTPHQRAAGPPPVIEGHRHRAARAQHRVHDCTAPGRVYRQGLLGDDVAAELHRSHDVPVVGGVHRGHDDGVGTSLPHHRVEVLRVEDGDRLAAQLLDDVAAVVVEPGRVSVAEAGQLAVVREPAHHGLHERQTAAPGADQRVPFTSCHGAAAISSDGWDAPS